MQDLIAMLVNFIESTALMKKCNIDKKLKDIFTVKKVSPRKTVQSTGECKVSTNKRKSKNNEVHVEINNLTDNKVKTCPGFKSSNKLLACVVIICQR